MDTQLRNPTVFATRYGQSRRKVPVIGLADRPLRAVLGPNSLAGLDDHFVIYLNALTIGATNATTTQCICQIIRINNSFLCTQKHGQKTLAKIIKTIFRVYL